MQIRTCLNVHAEAQRGPGGPMPQGPAGSQLMQDFKISIRLSDSNVVNRMKFMQVQTRVRSGLELEAPVLEDHFTVQRTEMTEQYDKQVRFSLSFWGLQGGGFPLKLPVSVDTILSIELEAFLEWENIIQQDVTLISRHKLILDWPDIELNSCKTWRLPFQRVCNSPDDRGPDWKTRFMTNKERVAQARKKLIPVKETPPGENKSLSHELSKDADSLRVEKKQSKKGLVDNLFKKSTLSG